MTSFPNIEDYVGAMTGSTTALEDQLPEIQDFQDLIFPALSTDKDTEDWYAKYGKMMDEICAADGATVSLTDGTLANQRTLVASIATALSTPTTLNKNDLVNESYDTFNPFNDTTADATYTRLMKVITTMYFTVYAKNKIK